MECLQTTLATTGESNEPSNIYIFKSGSTSTVFFLYIKLPVTIQCFLNPPGEFLFNEFRDLVTYYRIFFFSA